MYVCWSLRQYRLFGGILTELELYLQVLGKPTNIKFHKNPSMLCHGDGRSDGRT